MHNIQDQYQRRNGSTRIQRLVKIGSARDQVNMKCVRTGDPYLGIPKEELIRTALIRGASLEQYVLQYSALFHFAEIRSNPFVRTYCNDTYLERIHRDPASEQILKYSTSDNEIKKRKQRYYFEYYIPGNVKVVRHDTDVKSLVREKGINYQEDCWLKNGYLIVNLDIVTVDENGRERLSYINKENYLKRNWIL
mgnify:CR=1 FL=1